MPGNAVLLGSKSSLNFVGRKNDFSHDKSCCLSFDLLFDPLQTVRNHSALRINFFNHEISHRGFQASILFVPKGIMIRSGESSDIFDYEWKIGTPMTVRIELSYKENLVTVAIGDEFKQSVSLDAAQPKGVQAFQFTWGSANSQYAAAVARIASGPLDE